MTPVQMIMSIGVLIVNGSSISDGWNQTTESVNTISKDQVEKELNLLCEKLEEKKYDQNRTLWKLRMMPVEDILNQENVKKQRTVLKNERNNDGWRSPGFCLKLNEIWFRETN